MTELWPARGPLAPRINYMEQKLQHFIENHDDPEVTLLVQLTAPELILVHYGMMWLYILYGAAHGIAELRGKLNELVDAQDFRMKVKGEDDDG